MSANQSLSSPVALVNMPIAPTHTPSLGLSILQASLSDIGISSDIHYLNIKYANLVGLESLKLLSYSPTTKLIGDWLFAQALWGKEFMNDKDYIEQVLKDSAKEHLFDDYRIANEHFINEVIRCRDLVEAYLEDCLNGIHWERYKIVGFTSLFHQHIAALAMAKRIKRRFPHIVIVFGGANCVADMGKSIIDNFGFVDVVCTGMGEKIFPQFVSEYLAGKTPSVGSELKVRGSIPCFPKVGEKSLPMDEIPYPNFDDFFEQRKRYELDDENLNMLVETSRGCWWGQKHHCTFCGIDDESMKFKNKSSKRALAEFEYLIARYGHHTNKISVIDNIIPMEYLNDFLPKLRDSQLNVDVFYETKANLKKDQLKLYKQAGLNCIQPGIENFSDRLLREMNKGITGLQNIQFLKWCKEYGLRPIWNYMLGFPGERQEDYLTQIKLMKALVHLYPPYKSVVRMDRFSLYHSQPEEYGLTNLKPYSSFEFIYPLFSNEQIERAAYHFVADFEAKRRLPEYEPQLTATIEEWHEQFDGSALFHFELNNQLIVADFRKNTEPTIYYLSTQQRLIYEACDKVRNEKYLLKLIKETIDSNEICGDINTVIEDLLEKQIILCENRKYLSLGVSMNNGYFPPASLWGMLQHVFDKDNHSHQPEQKVPLEAKHTR